METVFQILTSDPLYKPNSISFTLYVKIIKMYKHKIVQTLFNDFWFTFAYVYWQENIQTPPSLNIRYLRNLYWKDIII